MTIIRNNSERVNYISEKIDSVADTFRINDIDGLSACINVQAEKDCTDNYRGGQKYLSSLQEHVHRASKYITQIGEVLEQADQDSARANLGR